MNKIVDFNSGLQENITSILNVEEVKNDIENINFAVESKNKNQMEKTHLMMDGKYSSYIPDFGKSMYCYNKNMGFIYDSLDEESLEHNLMLMMARLQGYLINEIKNNISSALQNSINLNIPITNEVNINISFNQVKEKIEKEGYHPMPKYIMALDAGTTSNRCILFNTQGEVCSVAQKEFTQIFPQPGWVEHDADEIFSTQLEVARQAMSNLGATATDIAAIGITNQRETTIVWDKNTGRPVYNAIVWQCRRTAPYCDQLTTQGLVDEIRSKTGLVIDPYFSGTKIRWILENVPGARQQAQRGELLFGTVETWLIWKLTGGRVHVTDYSNASRTMLFNINTLQWDAEILRQLDIPASMMPMVMPSSAVYGHTDAHFFGAPIPIAGAAGDQQAALFGQVCFAPGDSKCTYGTGAFLLMNTGEKPIFSKNGLVTTIAWGLDGKVNYALEGSIFVAGAAIQWLRDELRFIESAGDSEYMAQKVKDTNGCYVVPAFTGLGAPHWDAYARGAILGLTRGVNKYHIIRATLDSIVYQTEDVLAAMEADSGIRLSELKVDGGASANNYLVQTQADITAAPVLRPRCVETTAMGAAYLAGLAVGYWKNTDEIRKNWSVDRRFVPQISQQAQKERIRGWHKALQCAKGWAKE